MGWGWGGGGGGRGYREVWSLSCSCLLSSGLPARTQPRPRIPREGPAHSLFLQEVHLQALQVQEPAQLQEPPARKGKARGEQGEGCRSYSRRSAMPP